MAPKWTDIPGEPAELMRLVLDNIPQGVFWKDRDSRYLGCNLHFARAAGVGTPEAIRGKTDLDLPWSREEASWYRQVDQRVMEDDRSENHILETQLQADGHLTWLDTNKIPLHSRDGRVVGILGTFEDITERIQNQKALEQAHDELEAKVIERTAAEREQRTLAEALRDSAAVINSPHASASIVLFLADGQTSRRSWGLDPKTGRSAETFLAYPILTEGVAIGRFELHSPVGQQFSATDRERLATFANQAGLAIQNARLYERASETAALEERQRIARDLHDAISQTLWTISLLADLVPGQWNSNPTEARQTLDRLRTLTHGALVEMRTLLMELRPGALEGAQLPNLVRQLAAVAMNRKKIQIHVSTRGNRDVPPVVQTVIYRIAQEALSNVVRHSQATSAWIVLTFASESIRLSVRDNGLGFESKATPPDHYGLSIMKERAQAVGAKVSISSVPGKGTRVHFLWREAP